MNLLRLKDISRLTGFSVSSVRRWIREGKGPVLKRSPGGVVLIDAEEFQRWIDSLDISAEAGDAAEPKS